MNSNNIYFDDMSKLGANIAGRDTINDIPERIKTKLNSKQINLKKKMDDCNKSNDRDIINVACETLTRDDKYDIEKREAATLLVTICDLNTLSCFDKALTNTKDTEVVGFMKEVIEEIKNEKCRNE